MTIREEGDRCLTMVYRSGLRRRSRKRASFAVVLVGTGLCLLAGIFEKPARSPHPNPIIRTMPESYRFANERQPGFRKASQQRVVYPYSVVRGGVRNGEELAREMDRDPVVAAHFAGFDTVEARIERVRDDKMVHVSYRIKDQVFWTAKKVKLPQGENVITDGTTLARTRCGNQVSGEQQLPVSPDEPPAEVLDTPVVPEREEIAEVFAPLDIGDPWPITGNPRQPAFILPPYRPSAETWAISTIPPIGPRTPPMTVRPKTPPAVIPGVPEPGTLVLLGSGLALHFLIRRFKSK